MPRTFPIGPEMFFLVRDNVGVGNIVELPPRDAGLLARHIPGRPDTLYVAASGYLAHATDWPFRPGEHVVAFEWVRYETRPAPGEPECNVYRFVFGPAANGTGYCGVTAWGRTPAHQPGQVGDHWTTFDEVFDRHFES